MELNPMEYVEEKEKAEKETAKPHEQNAADELLAEERKDSKLNSWVAIAVALLATFVAICTVDEHSLLKSMQEQQAVSLDNWNFYQARNIRSAIAQTASDQFAIEAMSATGPAKAAFLAKSAEYKSEANYQNQQKAVQMKAAKTADETYERFKARDEHFELSEAVLAISVSLLALTSLTHKRWLFYVAMIPIAIGAFLGSAGLLHINLPLEAAAKILH